MLLAVLPLAAALAETKPLWELVPIEAGVQACPVSSAWGSKVPDGPVRRDSNAIHFIDGKPAWNGLPLPEDLLGRYVEVVAGMVPRPVTLVYGRGVPCDQLRRVTDLIAAKGHCTPSDCVVTFDMPPPISPPIRPAPPSPPTVSMAPPPPTPSPYSKRVTPRGAPPSWVSQDDYPAAAVRGYMTGTTGFRLAVGADGRVTGCTVTSSSGYPLLDTTTCALLTRRARFEPAEDLAGNRVESSWPSRFRWTLPSEWVPLNSWVIIRRTRAEPDGRITDCKREVIATPQGLDGPCNTLGSVTSAVIGKPDKPVWVEVRTTHLLDGAPLGSPEPAGARIVFRRVVHYSVDPSGVIQGCQVTARSGEDVLEMADYDCHPGYRYGASGSMIPGVTVTQAVTVEPAE